MKSITCKRLSDCSYELVEKIIFVRPVQEELINYLVCSDDYIIKITKERDKAYNCMHRASNWARRLMHRFGKRKGYISPVVCYVEYMGQYQPIACMTL